MMLAETARSRADCSGRKVGAVVIRDDRIISTGYNGTPIGTPNCSEGGCYRCGHVDQYPKGSGYDLCICVHAEQNAILAAARFGQSVLGSTMYTTTQPCFGCLKECLQAGIAAIYYRDPWAYPESEHGELLVRQYTNLQARFQAFGPI